MIQIAQSIPEPCLVWHGWQGSDGVESAFEMKFEVPESATAAWPGGPGAQGPRLLASMGHCRHVPAAFYDNLRSPNKHHEPQDLGAVYFGDNPIVGFGWLKGSGIDGEV